jgi:hypothetical protein
MGPETVVAEKLQDADLGASNPVPVEAPQPDTTVKHSVVTACGHKIDLRRLHPKHTNCPDCWEAFFATNPNGVGQIHQILVNEGRRGIEKRFGSKFTKFFGAFMRAQFMRQYEAKQAEEQVEASPSIEGSVMSIAEERDQHVIPQEQCGASSL